MARTKISSFIPLRVSEEFARKVGRLFQILQ